MAHLPQNGTIGFDPQPGEFDPGEQAGRVTQLGSWEMVLKSGFKVGKPWISLADVNQVDISEITRVGPS